ncbi:MAG: hypothetical protein Q4D99_07955 [Bacillota bacterium]|nr:hypothetical protein [Bacillota bacterium]
MPTFPANATSGATSIETRAGATGIITSRARAYDEEFIEKCVSGFESEMKGMAHEEYLLWRDRMVTETRLLKKDF